MPQGSQAPSQDQRADRRGGEGGGRWAGSTRGWPDTRRVSQHVPPWRLMIENQQELALVPDPVVQCISPCPLLSRPSSQGGHGGRGPAHHTVHKGRWGFCPGGALHTHACSQVHAHMCTSHTPARCAWTKVCRPRSELSEVGTAAQPCSQPG